MPVTGILAGIAVRNLDQSLGWYQRLLGRPQDALPMDGLADWTDEAGTIQLVQDAKRAGQSIITLNVDDLEALVATLRKHSLEPSDIDDNTSDKVLIATIADPDGNSITLVESR
jgi:hypothetical protein